MEQTNHQSVTPSTATPGARRISLANHEVTQPGDLQPLPTNAPPSNSTSKIPTFIVWSVFNLLMLPIGVLCCYFSRQVSQFKMQNRYAKANTWSKRTFVLNFITTLLMIGIVITVVMLRYDYKQRHDDENFNQTRTTGAFIPWQPGR